MVLPLAFELEPKRLSVTRDQHICTFIVQTVVLSVEKNNFVLRMWHDRINRIFHAFSNGSTLCPEDHDTNAYSMKAASGDPFHSSTMAQVDNVIFQVDQGGFTWLRPYSVLHHRIIGTPQSRDRMTDNKSRHRSQGIRLPARGVSK